MSKLVEEWRPVVGFKGLYEVSDWGRLMSLNYRRTGEKKIMIGSLDKDGYRRFLLRKNGRRYYKRLNVLVAEAFIPNPENKPIVGHLLTLPNGLEDKTANEAWNLAWMTYPENRNYGTLNERLSSIRSIVVYQYDNKGNLFKIWPSFVQIEKDGEFDSRTVCKCCKNKLKTYKGYIWSYEALSKEQIADILKKKFLKNRKDQSKIIYQYSLDGYLLKEWPSIAEAARHYSCHKSNIYCACVGKSKTAKGYIWSYVPL